MVWKYPWPTTAVGYLAEGSPCSSQILTLSQGCKAPNTVQASGTQMNLQARLFHHYSSLLPCSQTQLCSSSINMR